ncbi:two-component regulator propeller domain-containing protein [Algibacter sp. 2305UL17-15]|uniref:type IX secretion system anionic LPS delivery protein PorZ n=1 Tax=Algibacter sp. 2305UL17-15 TaxID=3231268 RepID=UPI003457B64C
MNAEKLAMLKKAIILFIYTLPLLQFAQDFSNLWKGYFSYYNITDIVSSETKIYASAENAVFSYDIQTKEIEKITTVNGLSGEAISTIFYSDAFGLLLIGYENGLMEVVLDDDDDVLTIVDIRDKPTIPPNDKRINHFNAHENLVYIATDFGISVFDLERLEFGDTYFIGNLGSQIEVKQTTIFNGFIYAGCLDGAGIRKAPITNTNLIDYKNWETIVGGNYSAIETIEDKLYTVRTDRRIYEINNDALSERFHYSDVPLKMVASDNNLLVTTKNNVFVYSSDFTLSGQFDVTAELNTKYTAATSNGDFIFIGTEDFGVLKTSLINATSFEEIRPDGPLLNIPFSIEAKYNNLWVTYGEYNNELNPYPLNSRGFSVLKETGWVNTPYSAVFEAKCLNTISVNPFNTSQVFISSFFNGILEVNDDIPTVLYDTTNSEIESLIIPTNPSYIDVRLGHSAFDENGLLWTITSRIQRPLKSYNPSNGQWAHYDFSEIVGNPLNGNVGFFNFVIAPDDTIFIASWSKGVIGFNANNGNQLLKNISDEEANLPGRTITSIALDKRNQLWIGTAKGLRVLYNTSNFFRDDVIADEIIIEEDGIAKELLFQQYISDIEVDGSNNKWIGTFETGLFYLSQDGQRTIFHFTKENSPLPSNIITDISIDEANGEVFIATQKGLVSFSSGSSATQADFAKSHAYPNPVRPQFDIVEEKVKIKDIPENVNIKITDIEGNLVAEAQSRTNLRYQGFNLEIDGGIAYWNGKNFANNVVASGVYLIMLADLDSFETKVIKLMVVR